MENPTYSSPMSLPKICKCNGCNISNPHLLHPQPNDASTSPEYVKLVQWCPPDYDYVKLNTDGSVLGTGEASFGGVFRDDSGSWMLGFTGNIGKSDLPNSDLRALIDVPKSELMAILEGLKLAKTNGFSKLSVESDSTIAISKILHDCHPDDYLYSLVVEIRSVMELFVDCVIGHVHREANKPADMLAKLGHGISCGFVEVYETTPLSVIQALFDDSNGVSHLRVR